MAERQLEKSGSNGMMFERMSLGKNGSPLSERKGVIENANMSEDGPQRVSTGAVDKNSNNGPGSERKALIKNVDMSEEMQRVAIECATQALDIFNVEKDIAAHIKKEFDKKYNPTWHCIVGKNFGSYVTHEARHFVYFYLGNIAFLLFKSG